MEMKGVICSGAIIHDTLVRPVEDPQWGTTTIVETIEAHVGGNAANTSIALATLGTPVRVVGGLGRDEQAPVRAGRADAGGRRYAGDRERSTRLPRRRSGWSTARAIASFCIVRE